MINNIKYTFILVELYVFYDIILLAYKVKKMKIQLNIDKFLSYNEILTFIKNLSKDLKKNNDKNLEIHFFSNNEDFFSSNKIINNLEIFINKMNQIGVNNSLKISIFINTIFPKTSPLNYIKSILINKENIKIIYHNLNIKYYLNFKLYNTEDISLFFNDFNNLLIFEKIDNKEIFKIEDYINY